MLSETVEESDGSEYEEEAELQMAIQMSLQDNETEQSKPVAEEKKPQEEGEEGEKNTSGTIPSDNESDIEFVEDEEEEKKLKKGFEKGTWVLTKFGYGRVLECFEKEKKTLAKVQLEHDGEVFNEDFEIDDLSTEIKIEIRSFLKKHKPLDPKLQQHGNKLCLRCRFPLRQCTQEELAKEEGYESSNGDYRCKVCNTNPGFPMYHCINCSQFDLCMECSEHKFEIQGRHQFPFGRGSSNRGGTASATQPYDLLESLLVQEQLLLNRSEEDLPMQPSLRDLRERRERRGQGERSRSSRDRGTFFGDLLRRHPAPSMPGGREEIIMGLNRFFNAEAPQPPPPSNSSVSFPPGPWNCPRCTYINGQSMPRCEMCAHVRPPPPKRTTHEGWIVHEVLSGNRIILRNGDERKTCELFGLSAPKIARKEDDKDAAFGHASREVLRMLCIGKTVRHINIERSPDADQSYTFAIVFDDEQDIGEQMLQRGWARCTEKASSKYSSTERRARNSKIGIWQDNVIEEQHKRKINWDLDDVVDFVSNHTDPLNGIIESMIDVSILSCMVSLGNNNYQVLLLELPGIEILQDGSGTDACLKYIEENWLHRSIYVKSLGVSETELCNARIYLTDNVEIDLGCELLKRGFARIIETKIENLDDIIEEMRKSQSIAVEQKLQLWAEESNENDKDVNPEEEEQKKDENEEKNDEDMEEEQMLVLPTLVVEDENTSDLDNDDEEEELEEDIIEEEEEEESELAILDHYPDEDSVKLIDIIEEEEEEVLDLDDDLDEEEEEFLNVGDLKAEDDQDETGTTEDDEDEIEITEAEGAAAIYDQLPDGPSHSDFNAIHLGSDELDLQRSPDLGSGIAPLPQLHFGTGSSAVSRRIRDPDHDSSSQPPEPSSESTFSVNESRSRRRSALERKIPEIRDAAKDTLGRLLGLISQSSGGNEGSNLNSSSRNSETSRKKEKKKKRFEKVPARITRRKEEIKFQTAIVDENDVRITLDLDITTPLNVIREKICSEFKLKENVVQLKHRGKNIDLWDKSLAELKIFQPQELFFVLQQDSSILFDKESHGEGIEILKEGKQIQCVHDAKWFVAMANKPFVSGRHSWSFRIDKITNPGKISFGVCKKNCSLTTWLGNNSNSWGLLGNGILWYKGSQMNNTIEDKVIFKEGDIVTIHLDMNARRIVFLRNGGNISNSSLDDLAKEVYPAIALYDKMDQVSLIETEFRMPAKTFIFRSPKNQKLKISCNRKVCEPFHLYPGDKVDCSGEKKLGTVIGSFKKMLYIYYPGRGLIPHNKSSCGKNVKLFKRANSRISLPSRLGCALEDPSCQFQISPILKKAEKQIIS